MNLTDLIKKQAGNCEKDIAELTAALDTYPEGRLHSYPNGGTYTRYVSQKGQGRIYLPKSDEDLAKALAQKALTEAKLQDCLAQQAACESYLRQIGKFPADATEKLAENADICRLLHRKIDDEYVEKWAAEDYQKNPKYPEHLKVPTVTGEKVRSKSEAMCVQMLHSMNIPFHYEELLVLSGRDWYPDFTVLRPGDHTTVWIEIFGMMDVPDYKRKTGDKLSSYFLHGIIPQINLLCFFETSDHPLDMEYMKNSLEHFLCM